MKRLHSYRTLVYAGTLATGATGLIYQVVWQKYLTFIVGSDARSVALVVAVFLAGLAAGYRFWGRTSERLTDRRKLLRLYGAIEFAIGLYAALFLAWLEVVRWIAQHAPSWLAADAFVTILALAGPTFLMGATIPLLVSVVPERPDEVHLAHAKIYGINTLGACFGAFASSFYLIPAFGLPATLYGASLVNLAVGTIFVLNRLTARVTRQEKIPEIPNSLPLGTIYLYTLITGTVTLSLEVLLVRVLNLTLGAGPHNFAIIVGVFILGLAAGSLAITERMLSLRALYGALTFLTLYLMVLFHSVPFWPYWVTNLRVLLRSIPEAYPVHLGVVTAALAVLAAPFLVPLGFMLPLAYALLPKSTADYGKKCGWLYFYNTLGTAIGAVVLSYLLLAFVDLDIVYKIDVALLALLALALFTRDRRHGAAVALGSAALLFLAGPGWNRDSHYLGLYGHPDRQSYHFQGWFKTPRLVTEVDFFEDGPDTTVAVVINKQGGLAEDLAADQAPNPYATSRALLNNGRSEGDTVGDYSTMVLAGLLPYLYAPDHDGLDVAVIGLGTGMTAGLVGGGEDVATATVVEISSTLIEAARRFDEFNFGLSQNSRVEILPMDGFRYFARLSEALDVVISEPSVPWVSGVENLFTPEYYRLAAGALRDDGIFMQWFPMYTIDPVQFRTIVGNLTGVFPHLRMFRLSQLEVGVIAGMAPLTESAVERRLAEPLMREAAGRLQLVDVAQLEFVRLYEDDEVRQLVASGERREHTLDHPSLAYGSDRIRFVSANIAWDDYLDPRLQRLRRFRPERGAALEAFVARHPQGVPCGTFYGGAVLFCGGVDGLIESFKLWISPWPVPLERRLGAYDALRQQGFVGPSPDFLRAQAEDAAARGDTAALRPLLLACERDGQWDAADAVLAAFRQGGAVDEATAQRLAASLAESREMYRLFVESYR